MGKESRGKSWAGEDISKVSTEEGGGWAESWRADEREETSIVLFQVTSCHPNTCTRRVPQTS